MRSLYFIAYALTVTVIVIIMAVSFYFRFRKHGTPIHYKSLKVMTSVAMVLWMAAAFTEYGYHPGVATTAAAAFSTGVFVALLIAWRLNAFADKLQAEARTLPGLACHDEVTGLLNRRLFHEQLRIEFARSMESKTPLAVLITEVDEFSKINETRGYLAGDKVLRALGKRLCEFVRESDVVFRCRGNKIALILSHANAESMRETGERIKADLRKFPLEIEKGELLAITLGMGIASTSEAWDSDAALIEGALGALGSALSQGRDGIVVCRGKGQYQEKS